MSLIVISYFTDVLYLLDVLFNFFMVDFDEHDEMIIDQKVIARNYLRGWFVPDILTTFPFEIFIPRNSAQMPKLLRILKLSKIRKLLKMFRIVRVSKILREYKKMESHVEQESILTKEGERLIITVFGILVFCHFNACLWYFMQRISEPKMDD